LLREYASPSADAVQSRINVNVVPGGPLKAYIANFGSNTISICPLNNNGSLNVGACVQQSGSYLLNPSDVLIHPQLQVAYIANQSLLGLATCSVNLDGTFGACSTTRAGGNFDNIIDLAFNKAKTYLYVAGTSTKIYICPINGDGSLGTCTISTGNGTFRTVQGIALNSSGTFAYISSAGNNTISVCPINTDSTFGTCTVFSDPTLGFNQGVSFNANETYAYIPNGDSRSTVSICPVNQATGTLSACTSTNGNGTFSMSGFAGNLSMGSTQNIGYIPNDTSNTISLCTINQTTGALSNCTAVSSSGFNTSCSIGFY
jgi:6-phosphogluconolactonase (cycloisomerase 2 family)